MKPNISSKGATILAAVAVVCLLLAFYEPLLHIVDIVLKVCLVVIGAGILNGVNEIRRILKPPT